MRPVLLVHPDADAWLDALPDLDAQVTTAHSATEARAYLAGTTFDLVLVGADVESGDRVAALRDALGLSSRVETVADAADAGRYLGVGAAPAGGDPRDELAHVRDELGRIAHALNNPLAVIAGNAELGVELARAVETDGTIVEALASIREGAAELEGLFSEVAALRHVVGRALDRLG